MLAYLRALWSRLVFALKHRAGYMDLGRDIQVTGTVVSVRAEDGDYSFNVQLDPDYGWSNTWAGGTKTTEDDRYPDTIHCEIVPWIPLPLDFEVGDRVTVFGRWGFDGCHTGMGWFMDVLLGILGHGPNPDGWIEIHPVTWIIVHVS